MLKSSLLCLPFSNSIVGQPLLDVLTYRLVYLPILGNEAQFAQLFLNETRNIVTRFHLNGLFMGLTLDLMQILVNEEVY